ncbi:MAG: CRTAC1 family protein [Phycisphaerales bacterium]
MKRPMHHHAVALSALLHIAPGLAHAQQHEADAYHWLNDFVLADVNGDTLLDIAATNHAVRTRIRLNQGDFTFATPDSESPFSFRHVFPELTPADDTPDMSEPALYIFYDGPWGKLVRKGMGEQTGNIAFIADTDDPQPSFELIDAKGDVELRSRSQIQGRKQLVVSFSGDFELTLAPTNTRRTLSATVLIPDSIDSKHVRIGPRALEATSNQVHFTGFSNHDWHNTIWTDLNADGMLDLFVAQGGDNGQATKDNRVYNDLLILSGPTPLIHNAATESGIIKDGMAGRGAMIADIDQNGLPDIYVRNNRDGSPPGKYSNLLHMQQAPLQFQQQAAQRNLDITTHGIGKWFDVDSDGWPEMVWGDTSGVRLFRNNKGTFTQQTISTDFYYVNWLSIGDFDNDGDIDIATAGYPESMICINDNGTLVPKPFADFGLPRQCSGIQWVDYNNDGRLDLYAPPSGLYTQASNASFTASGLLETEKGWDPFAWGDLDNDGRMDLVRRTTHTQETVVIKTDISARSVPVYQTPRYELAAFENTIKNSNGWIQLDLVGPPNNPQAIGATALLENNGTKQLAMVTQLDSSQSSLGHYRIHFGLGQPQSNTPAHPFTLTIRWPDGKTTNLSNPQPNTLHTIRYDQHHPNPQSHPNP